MQTTISRKVKPMIQDNSQIDKYRQNIFRRPAAQNNFTGNTTAVSYTHLTLPTICSV